MENDEKKYEDVIKSLKSLKKVDAPENFEADLKRRINSEKFSEKERKSFWENVFVPARLIPSLGLVAAAVVIFFVVETNSEEMDNPFLIEPRAREDVIEVTENVEDELEKNKELLDSKSSKEETSGLESWTNESESKPSVNEELKNIKKDGGIDKLSDERDFARDQSTIEGKVSVPESTIANLNEGIEPKPSSLEEASADIVSGQTINKEELNFRQVQLSSEEQKVVNELKMQVQSLEKADQRQK